MIICGQSGVMLYNALNVALGVSDLVVHLFTIKARVNFPMQVFQNRL